MQHHEQTESVSALADKESRGVKAAADRKKKDQAKLKASFEIDDKVRVRINREGKMEFVDAVIKRKRTTTNGVEYQAEEVLPNGARQQLRKPNLDDDQALWFLEGEVEDDANRRDPTPPPPAN